MSDAFAEPRLPRLLLGIGRGPMSLEEHRWTHGEAPLGRRGRGAGLIESIERAGLRGHGGAGFPTAVKLRAAGGGGGRRRRPVVVANGAEGEPASRKDRLLAERLPHLVLDGGLLAAEAIGAGELVVCLAESALAARQGVSAALEERRAESSVGMRVDLVPDRYISGQETALVQHLNGGPAIPTLSPPRPTDRGVGRRPTVIGNLETLAHLALIARHGADWFRGLGTPDQPGSALVTLSGAVAGPDVYEIAYGSSLRELIAVAGGATDSIRAVLVGGYSGGWVPPRALPGLRLSDEHLAPFGAAVGTGVIHALPAAACPVAETARISRWLSDESAGQCGPCVHGLDAIATALETVARGTAPAGTGEEIARWETLVVGRGACGHPDAAVRFISSSVRVFADEFADHAAHGPCHACARPSELPLPRTGPRQASTR